jgi:hypothetical protein
VNRFETYNSTSGFATPIRTNFGATGPSEGIPRPRSFRYRRRGVEEVFIHERMNCELNHPNLLELPRPRLCPVRSALPPVDPGASLVGQAPLILFRLTHADQSWRTHSDYWARWRRRSRLGLALTTNYSSNPTIYLFSIVYEFSPCFRM